MLGCSSMSYIFEGTNAAGTFEPTAGVLMEQVLKMALRFVKTIVGDGGVKPTVGLPSTIPVFRTTAA